MTRAGVDEPDALSRAVSHDRTGARRHDVYLFTDMAVMIDGIARKAGSPP
jgi:hypothetical protein